MHRWMIAYFSGIMLFALLFYWAQKRANLKQNAQDDFAAAWWQGLSTEMVGAAIVTILLGIGASYIGQVEEEISMKNTLRRENIRAQLIYDMGSLDNTVALHAVRRLKNENEWLYNETLKDQEFFDANLQNADLQNAHLRGANFTGANLTGANLTGAILLGTIFTNANLENVQLSDAKFDEKTILPDGTPYDPDSGLDQLDRFTDAQNLDFWRPDPDDVWWYTVPNQS